MSALAVDPRRSGASVPEVELAGLKVGARLADDAVTVGGKLLATRGRDVSEELRERLTNLRGIVRQPLPVLAAGQKP
jgi:hypothetical protein